MNSEAFQALVKQHSFELSSSSSSSSSSPSVGSCVVFGLPSDHMLRQRRQHLEEGRPILGAVFFVCVRCPAPCAKVEAQAVTAFGGVQSLAAGVVI